MWKTYTIKKGCKQPMPPIMGLAGERLLFSFILDQSWLQLYESLDDSTHKILGISDLLGNNSLRLGVRRKLANKPDSLIAVAYQHINGKFYYPAIKLNGVNFELKPDIIYNCIIEKNQDTGYYQISLNNTLYQISLNDTLTETKVKIAPFGRRLSGLYVEVGSAPSRWDITTTISIL